MVFILLKFNCSDDFNCDFAFVRVGKESRMTVIPPCVVVSTSRYIVTALQREKTFC